ncbi:hypothetical protein EPH_0063540 [Eimeria praecox]|uniref:Uncharacterized protein n=1 Tax=Eimeria praecox TaxID=51316 RepID=U6H1R9_9EIME|nr:hypothetical protein EPH_0063540 [Eimeria praecox]
MQVHLCMQYCHQGNTSLSLYMLTFHLRILNPHVVIIPPRTEVTLRTDLQQQQQQEEEEQQQQQQQQEEQ